MGLWIGPVRMRAAVTEDHIIEWLQVGLLAVSAALLIRVCVAARRNPESRRAGCALAVLAFCAVVVLAEEISWGQRIFGFRTPAVFSAENAQGEFNLHNLKFFHQLRNWLPLAFSLVGIGLVLLGRRRRARTTSVSAKLLLPDLVVLPSLVLCLAVSVWLLVLYIGKLQTEGDGDWFVGRVVAEWSELMVGYALFLYAYQKACLVSPRPSAD